MTVQVLMTAYAVCHPQYLVHLGHHLREEGVQGGELPAEVDVPLKACRVGDCLWVRDFEQEALHVGPLVLQELVHEGHVLFLVTKSDGKQGQERERGTKNKAEFNFSKFHKSLLKKLPRGACCLDPNTQLKKKHTHLVKFARFWVTLAMSVSVRAVRSSGYSCIKLKSEGDMMAGQRNRRNKDALIKRSLMSGRPRLLHSCRHDAKTSFSSRGNTLSRIKKWDRSCFLREEKRSLPQIT